MEQQDQYTYVLKLQRGKWYVGATNNPYRRLMQHFSQGGSAQKYPPIQIHKVAPSETVHDEDNLTFEYMMEYGVENVRGGIYVQTVLPDEQVREIERRRRMKNGLCVICGEDGHLAADCSDDEAPEEEESPTRPRIREREPERECLRCGRGSHDVSTCYARTNVNGRPLRYRNRHNNGSNGEFRCPGCNEDPCDCGLNC